MAACGDGADGLEEIGAGGGFLEVAKSTGAEGAMDFFVAGEGGEDEDAGSGVGSGARPSCAAPAADLGTNMWEMAVGL